jgi:hypothetical protein
MFSAMKASLAVLFKADRSRDFLGIINAYPNAARGAFVRAPSAATKVALRVPGSRALLVPFYLQACGCSCSQHDGLLLVANLFKQVYVALDVFVTAGIGQELQ